MKQARKIGQPEPAAPSPTPATDETPGSSGTKGYSALMDSLSAPVETVEMPEHLQEWHNQATEDDEAPYTEEEAQQAGLSPETVAEHGDLAKLYIGMLDGSIGTLGWLATRMQHLPSRYMAFHQEEPPEYYVRAAAAVIAKYEAVMGPEMLLLSAIATAYQPVAVKVYQDRKANTAADAKKEK